MASFTVVCFGVFLGILAGHTLAIYYTTDGDGGDVCGDRVCMKGKAYCDGTECKCNKTFDSHGDGTLNCYKKSEFRTEVTNDPRILTYNNNSIDLPVPCRYLLTHAVTEYKDRAKKVVGSCEIMVHAFHKKKHGKFYVEGFDVAIRIECNNGSRYEMSIRKYGKAENGIYDFYVKATDGQFLPNGPFGNDEIDFHDPKTNLKIKCKIDDDNNLAIIDIKKCGGRINFRPYDCVKKRNQTQVPGLAVAFSCAYKPEFETPDRAMAMIPLWAHNGFTIGSILIPKLGKVGTMIYRAYMSGIPQTQPNNNTACSAAKDSIMACPGLTELQDGFGNCTWILRSPRFIRCYDKTDNGFDIQELFNTCIDIYCAQTSSCGDVRTLITQEGCLNVTGYPEKDDFLGDCPP